MSDATINIADKQKFKMLIEEIIKALQRIEDEKLVVKDMSEAIESQFEIKKSVAVKLARTIHKSNFDDIKEENEYFEELYELIVRK
jgi:hypothetical protein